MSADEGRRPLPVVFGCAGPVLTASERAFFRDADPLGFILFRRNCENPDQVRGLVGSLRDAVGRAEAPILIDQEGGRVRRLCPPHWPGDPAPARLGALAVRDLAAGERAAYALGRAIAADLDALSIDVDAFPVLDLAVSGASDVIGDRAFSGDAALVTALGRAACNGLLDGGVLPVIKHLPGHGRALVDSHVALPRVEADEAELAASDFVPFRSLADMPWGMTAHVVYTGLDPMRPATLSPEVIGRTIRRDIGFDGVLVSDDLCMGALTGRAGRRASAALVAGCDLALHCNGEPAEMQDIAAEVGAMGEATAARLARAAAMRRRAEPVDAASLRTEVDALLNAV